MTQTFSQTHDDAFSSRWVNLAEKRLGTKVLFASDDFFAEKENLIEPGRGIFKPDEFTDRGKWMDGWESRRKRAAGHDFCDLRLGLSGVIRGLDVDTNHFIGNYPEHASVQACCIDGDPNPQTQWTELLPKSRLNPGTQHLFPIENPNRWTHVRLHIHPDGGVARFRVYGEVRANWDKLPKPQLIDLAAVQNEGKVLLCSDMHFSNKNNLIAPGRGINMGDGWETKRRRGAGHDWAILALGRPGNLERVEVDTLHFKGNYPDRCSLEGVYLEHEQNQDLNDAHTPWVRLLDPQKLKAHHLHVFQEELKNKGPFSHVRLNIFPDGGVGRLRLWGHRK